MNLRLLYAVSAAISSMNSAFFVACAVPAGRGAILSRSSFQPDGLEVRLVGEVGGRRESFIHEKAGRGNLTPTGW